MSSPLSLIKQSSSDPSKALLICQLKEMFGRVAYTHATHLNQMRIVQCNKGKFQVAETALTALSSTALIATLLKGESWVEVGAILAAALTTFSLGISLYSKYSMHAELVAQHKAFASELWKLREELLSMLFDLEAGTDLEAMKSKRDEINVKLATLYASAPVTSAEAYTKAQEQLKQEEALFFQEWELNRMLPAALRSAAGTDTAEVKK